MKMFMRKTYVVKKKTEKDCVRIPAGVRLDYVEGSGKWKVRESADLITFSKDEVKKLFKDGYIRITIQAAEQAESASDCEDEDEE